MRWLTLLLLLTSCFLQVEKTPIYTPKIDRQYYLNSIEAIEEAIEEQPDYVPFIELQLSYYERLGWPSTAEEAIQRAEQYLANDQQFFNQKIAYYQSNKKYEQVAELLKKYPVTDRLPLDLQLMFTDALIEMQDVATAREQLNDLLAFSPDSMFGFVLDGFLRIGDSLQVVDLLYEQRNERAAQLIEFYDLMGLDDSIRSLSMESDSYFETPKQKRILAQSLLAIDSTRLAEQLIVSDTTIEGRLLLLEAYERQYKLVSATYVLDQLLIEQPTNSDFLKKRASVSDRRGYYEAALYYANQAIRLDSTDQEAAILIDQINQKIAYLRQQQQEQQITPMLGLDSLKKGM